MKLISWNVAGRVAQIDRQIQTLQDCSPDIIALQEVTPATALLFQDKLPALGLNYVVESGHLAVDPSFIASRKRSRVLLASRWPLCALPPLEIDWPEKVLSGEVSSPFGKIEVHAAHIPNGSNNGWIKINTLTGLFGRLACRSASHRFLCGDFNAPMIETADGQVITCAQKQRLNGEVVLRNWVQVSDGSAEDWDRGERSILTGLAPFDLADVYRSLHGYSVTDFSWASNRQGKVTTRRFDHVFASKSLNAVECRYLHSYREQGLSDHSPIEAKFAPFQGEDYADAQNHH